MSRNAIILNVDGEEASRVAVTHLLRSAGFEVWEAASGREALQSAQLGPDLILLDINLTDMRGHDVCRQLKNDPRTSAITVLPRSAHIDAMLTPHNSSAVCLDPPLTPQDLLAQVQWFMRTREAEASQRFLARAGSLLASSLDQDECLTNLADVAVPFLGDVCIVHRLEADGSIRPAAMRHRKHAAPVDLSMSLSEMTLPYGAAHVINTGQAQMYPVSDSDEPLGAEHPAILRQLSASAYLCVPLIARGRTLGAITLVLCHPRRRYNTQELLIAEDLASRASTSIDNARLYEEAQAAVGTRDNLLAIVSHDLKNPLTSILMSNALLERYAARSEEFTPVRKHVSIIERSARRMERLIEDLLDLASIEAGQFTIERGIVEVDPLLREIVELHASQAQEKDIALDVSICDTSQFVSGDRQRIQQVLCNLLSNALKFTRVSGCVTLRARRATSEMEFAVADEGPGIAAEHVPHLFERFWRARRTAREGSGLGLCIAKSIVEAHRGRIWVESAVDRGTTFWFTLPLISTASADYTLCG